VRDRLFEFISPLWQHRICRLQCRLIGHRRIVYGAMRDICIDCLVITNEHPDGRRSTLA
jgi:hypothetical protein